MHIGKISNRGKMITSTKRRFFKINNYVFFLLSFAIFMALHLQAGLEVKDYHFDSGYYWSLGKSFVVNGTFSLTNLSETWRGYVYPLFLCLCSGFGNLAFGSEEMGFMVFSSLIYSTLFTVILPEIGDILFPKSVDRKMFLIPLILSLVFWKGLFIYPLTDVFAIVLNLCLCIIAFNIINYQIIPKNSKKIFRFLLNSFLFGFVGYLVYNVRSIYQFSFIIGIILILYINRKKGVCLNVIFIVVSLFGLIIASVPQIIVNYNHANTFSMWVPVSSLLGMQLFWGIYTPKYETNIGTAYPTPQMNFIDMVGRKLLDQEGVQGFNNYFDYVNLVLQYPIDFLGIYGRHIFSALLLVFPEIYNQNVDNNKEFLVLFNYSLIYIGALGLLIETKRRKDLNNNSILKHFSPLVMILAPCIFILPGALEPRFVFAAYLVFYSFIAFAFPISNVLNHLKKHWIANLVIFMFGLVTSCAIWGNILISLEYGGLLFK